MYDIFGQRYTERMKLFQIYIDILLQIVTIRIGYPKKDYFFMKKTFITTLLMLVSCMFLKADAMIVVDYLGPTASYPMGVERNLIINSDDGGDYDIAVRPLDDALVRSDGEVRIPLEHVYINNTHEDIFMRYNEYSTVFKSLEMNGMSKNMVAKVRDYGVVPAGVYNLNFEIQAVDAETRNVVTTSSFNLQFIVPVEQKLGVPGQKPRINVDVKDAFAVNKKIVSETNPQVYVTSNTDWVLVLRNDYSGEQPGYYYVRTVSASPNVTQRLQERVRVEEGKEIIIARGKAPANNEYVSVEYSVEGMDGQILKPGDFKTGMKYILRQYRGQ